MPELPRSLDAPSDHLLRTMAAVPVTSYVLDLGCGRGRHTVPLLRLGFPVHACDPRPEAVEATRKQVADLLGEEGDPEAVVQPASLDGVAYPDDAFDWIVAYRAEVFAADREALLVLLREARRMLKPGAWLYLTLPASADAVLEHGQAQGDGSPEAAPTADPAAVNDAVDVSLDDVSDGPTFAVQTLEAVRSDADLALSVAPTLVREHGEARIRAIYRRVDRREDRRDG